MLWVILDDWVFTYGSEWTCKHGNSDMIWSNSGSTFKINRYFRFKDHAVWVDGECLQSLAVNAQVFGPKPEESSRLLHAEYKFILGHPEILTSDTMIRLIYRPNKTRITYIAVDEAHVINSWGQSEFRPAFLKIGTLRSVLPQAKVVAVTATATPSSQKEITRLLRMPNPVVIGISPEKHNLFLEVRQRHRPKIPSSTIEDEYECMLDYIMKRIGNSKTIIFAKLKWCGYAHEYLSGHMSKEMVVQYHSPQTDEEKARIISDLTDPNGKIRVVLATEALAMGVDISDIRFVVNASPPSSLEMYLQEIGRCGRDGQPATSLLFYSPSDIGRNIKNVDQSMKDYCVLVGDCRTKFVLDYFGFASTDCDRCDHCINRDEDVALVKARVDRRIFGALKNYFVMENESTGEPMSEVHTGLSASLAHTIASNVDLACDRETLRSGFSFITEQRADSIIKIVSALKDSVQIESDKSENDSDNSEKSDSEESENESDKSKKESDRPERESDESEMESD